MELSSLKPKSSWIACVTLSLAVGSGSLAAQDPKSVQGPTQTHYTVTDLGTLPGGTFSQAYYINDFGLVAGVSTAADAAQHAVVWTQNRIIDLSKPGLGGPNSLALAVNDFGAAIVQAESSEADPNNENFCAYGTGLKCLPYVWQNGVTIPLPSLGGNNANIDDLNNRGQVVGYAENRTRDPQCPSGPAVNGTGPQVLDFEAVVWGPRLPEIRELRPLKGDTVGVAFWINDEGETVGISGSCANTLIPPVSAGPHAVLWEKDGSVHDLGNLGGTIDPTLLGVGNAALAINNRGEVVGTSPLAGNIINHAFLWTKATGMRDIGTIPGDSTSVALANNDRGEIVGSSFDADGNPRAFVRQNGVMTDLNTLVPTDTALYLIWGSVINNRGQIVGYGVDAAGDVHAYVATPCGGCQEQATHIRARVHLSDYTRSLVEANASRRLPMTQPH
jgi:probable HAF family extracellular repeat protein